MVQGAFAMRLYGGVIVRPLQEQGTPQALGIAQDTRLRNLLGYNRHSGRCLSECLCIAGNHFRGSTLNQSDFPGEARAASKGICPYESKETSHGEANPIQPGDRFAAIVGSPSSARILHGTGQALTVHFGHYDENLPRAHPTAFSQLSPVAVRGLGSGAGLSDSALHSGGPVS